MNKFTIPLDADGKGFIPVETPATPSVGTAGPLNDIEDGSFARAILMGLQGKPVYMGTVDPVTVAERRADNKVARKSRRINRGR